SFVGFGFAKLGGGRDQGASPRLDGEGQFDQREADVAGAADDGFDFIEANQRQPARADGQRRDQTERNQQLRRNALIPVALGNRSVKSDRVGHPAAALG